MSTARYVVDIRRHRGDSAYVIDLVSRFSSRTPGATVEWLVRPDQASFLPSAHIIGQADPLDTSWGARIRERLVRLSKETQDGGASGPFWVLSYDNQVLFEAGQLKSSSLQVETLHLGVIRNLTLRPVPLGGRQIATVTTPSTAWRDYPVAALSQPIASPALTQPTTVLTLTEAIDIAKSVLRRWGHSSPETALPQTNLRPRMCFLDERVVRRPGDPFSETLIATIVDTGLQEGWLKKVRFNPLKPETAALYLNEVPAANEPKLPETSTAPLNHEVPETPLGATQDVVSTVIIGDGKEVDTVSPLNPSTTKSKKHPNRATEFEAVLSKSRIGSMPETREALFDAVEAVLGNSNANSVAISGLFNRATMLAKERAQAANSASERNWPVAERCTRRLMLWAGVLKGEDGKQLVDTIGINASRVLKLDSDFRRVCEAFLAQHIIEKLNGISFDDDTYYLGLTLYRRGGARAVPADELKARADAVLLYLVENGQIEMDSERTIRAKSAQKVLSIAS